MTNNIHHVPHGEMDIHVLSEGNMKAIAAKMIHRVPPEEWRPFVATDAAGWMVYGMNTVHVAFRGRSIVIDTGLGEAHPSRDRFNRAFPISHVATVWSNLSAIGVDPGQVDTVILSHVHADHIMGTTIETDAGRTPVFPNARHLVSDIEYREGPKQLRMKGSLFALHMPVLVEHNLVDLVELDYEVLPGIEMIHTPGESPGHACVRMESCGRVVYYAGDLFNHPAEVLRPAWVAPGRDQPSLQRSREWLIQRAMDENALIISSHIMFPGIGRFGGTPEAAHWVPVLETAVHNAWQRQHLQQ